MASPVGRGRLPLRRPHDLDDEQRALYARISQGPRAARAGSVPITARDGALLGPFAVMTVAPQVGDAVQQLGAALRFAGQLDPLTREAAILIVAAHHRSEFEWFTHEAAARHAGLTDDQLDAIRARELPEGVPTDTHIALSIVRTLLESAALDDATYAMAIDSLGERTLAEIVWLTGYYAMLALALAVFQPPNPLTTHTAF